MTVATLAGQQLFSDLAQPPLSSTNVGTGFVPVSSVYQPQQSMDATNMLFQINGLNGLYYPTAGTYAESSVRNQQQQQQLIQQQILLQQQQQQQFLLSTALTRPAFGVGANFAAPSAPPQLQIPTASTTTSFEGMPIFIVPQSGTLSLNALQRANEFKLAQLNSLTATPKIDTSKHFHVFVGDLSSEVDNKMLKEAFDHCGTISETKVIRDAQSLKSRGYGFVSFPEKSDAQRAIDEMNGVTVGRRVVRTNWASRRAAAGSAACSASDDEKGATTAAAAAAASSEADAAAIARLTAAVDADNTTVYVGNLANSVEGDGDREKELRDAFKQFGDIKEIRLFLAQNYGFVVFERQRSAAHAILTMNGAELSAHSGRRLRCSWGRAGLSGGAPSQHDASSLNALATAQLIAAQYAASQANQSITAAAQNANALLAAQMSALSHQQQQQQHNQQQMAAVTAAYATAAATASGAPLSAIDALGGQLPQGVWPS